LSLEASRFGSGVILEASIGAMENRPAPRETRRLEGYWDRAFGLRWRVQRNDLSSCMEKAILELADTRRPSRTSVIGIAFKLYILMRCGF